MLCGKVALRGCFEGCFRSGRDAHGSWTRIAINCPKIIRKILLSHSAHLWGVLSWVFYAGFTVRHTPAFVFVHRFAIGTATGSSFSPLREGMGWRITLNFSSYQWSAAAPSPLGEGWPKAGVCCTVKPTAGISCRIVKPTVSISCRTVKPTSSISCRTVKPMPIPLLLFPLLLSGLFLPWACALQNRVGAFGNNASKFVRFSFFLYHPTLFWPSVFGCAAFAVRW